MTSVGLAVLLALALLVSALVVRPRIASACECLDTSVTELAEQADVVFEGRAIRHTSDDRTWLFRVERVWKGVIVGRVSVRSHPNSCGVPLRKGRYVVYGIQGAPGSGKFPFSTGWCEGTRRSSQADEHFAALGPGLSVAYLRVALGVFAPPS